MKKVYAKNLLLLLTFALTLFGIFCAGRNVDAASSDIVISEIMYNPASGNQADEFLELYNKGSSAVDISGWSFGAGISLIFSSGTTIAPGSFVVISPDPVQTQSTYSVTPIATYSGALSNSGEQITLLDNTASTVADITYDDTTPWPSSSDGNGPSLEMIEPASGDYTYGSWAASLNSGGTPAASNTLTGLSLAQVTNVTELAAYQSTSASPVVTADVSGANSVNLIYKVMFGADQSVPMYDDGAHGDGAAGDGTYGASIPAQAAGQLVRYKVIANNGLIDTSKPSNDESINYYGYAVDDNTASDSPIFRWYIDDSDFTDMVTNHTNDDQAFPTVILVGTKAYDNATVYIKGDSSTSFPKKKFKFDLPSGYFVREPFFNYDVDEFAIQVYFLNFLNLQEKLSWLAVQEAGFAGPQSEYVRVMKNDGASNSAFYGQYLLTETFDKTWREQHGYQTGAYYKDFYEKKTRLNEDTSDRDTMVSNIHSLTGDALKQYLLDNFDVPTMINYSATMAVIRDEDRGSYYNVAYYRDSDGDLRWRVLPYDLDNAMSPPVFNENGLDSLIDPNFQYSSGSGVVDRDIEYAFYQFPEFREMFYRRAASLYDQLFKSGKVDAWIDELYQSNIQTATEDHNKWAQLRADLLVSLNVPFPYTLPADSPLAGIFPSDPYAYVGTLAERKSFYDYGFTRYQQMVDYQRQSGNFDAPQAVDVGVIINEIMYNPNDGDDYEYLELYNPNSTAVDLSGWQIQGVDGVLPAGSVLPAKSYGLMVKNDLKFRQKYGSGKLIFGQYSGDLADSGERLAVVNASGKTVAELTYTATSPWPSSELLSSGDFSLSLIKTDYNYALPQCWAPSLAVLGTPGADNGMPNTDQLESACLKLSGEVSTGAPAGSSTAHYSSDQVDTKPLAESGSSQALALLAGLLLIFVATGLTKRLEL